MPKSANRKRIIQVLSDLEVKDIVSNLYTIEIGLLGHWLHASQEALLQAAPLLTKLLARKIMDACQPARTLEPLQLSLRRDLT